MALLKKKKKSSGIASKMSRSGGGSATQISNLRPRYVTSKPPCGHACPSSNRIRDWLMVIALRDKLGLSLDEACECAWRMEMDTNPFPAIMGRVCPHPCESHCNRKEKDGPVGINAVERFIGDYGIEHELTAEPFEGSAPTGKKVAVIGAGPSGLSCAFQLARYGHSVKVFESLPKPGGMLRYGIPVYRLPREIIDAEVAAIERVGVEVECGVKVGKDIPFSQIRDEYDAIYVAIGAHQGKGLGIPGEEGPGIWTGTEFLNHVNSGKSVDLGDHVVIIGGGDTAIDAARVSKRVITDSAELSAKMGADVTILYRRTRAEMPAIEREIEEAIEENIGIEYLAAPKEILRDEEGAVRGLIVQRMALGEPDDSGRRRPVPIENDTYEVPLTTMIAAVSQKPDLASLGSEELGDGWLNGDDWGFTGVEGIWTGGDNINLGIATTSIGQGRTSAEAIHAYLQGAEPKRKPEAPVIGHDKIMLDWYEAKERQERQVKSAEARLAAPFDEVDLGYTAEQALEEVTRCFSCGKCFGCENCWMYCQNNVFKKAKPQEHGHFFDIKMELCDGCKKCWEECPCGFILGE